MRRLAVLLSVVLTAGCASVERPTPLAGADIVMLARNGKTPPEIIEELKRTDTVLPLQASDYVRLHEAGVPDQVLDYLQLVQIDDIRWRERYSIYQGYCPFPCTGPYGIARPYRAGRWGC
jgi:hypothetical protein